MSDKLPIYPYPAPAKELPDDVFMYVEWKTREELEKMYPPECKEMEKDPESFIYTKAELDVIKHQAIVEAGFSLEAHNQLLHRAAEVILAHHNEDEVGDGGQWLRDFEDFMYGESTPNAAHNKTS